MQIELLGHYVKCGHLNTIWGSWLGKSYIFISNQPSTWVSHSVPIFKGLKLLRIVDIFKMRLLSFVYELDYMVAPDCFHNLFSLNSTVHCHNTRQSTRCDLFLAYINTSKYGLKSIRYLGAILKNELPIAIRTSPSKFIFKSL